MELIVGSVALARVLEASDARNAALSAKELLHVAGGSVAYAGPGSPLTHAIGVGMDGPVTPADLEVIESFYRDRGCSQVNIDLCPLADPALNEQLGARGYRIVEFNNVMVRGVDPLLAFTDERVESVQPDGQAEWSRVLAEGFFEHDPLPEELQIGDDLYAMEGAAAFLARIDGIAAAGGAMAIHGPLATLFGDATLKPYRGRGLQSAIILARLAHAAAAGCGMATAATVPGSVSHRNYERCGFRVAYTKLNMQRDL